MDTKLSQLEDKALLHATRELVRRSNATEAELLLHLAEVEARKAYAPLGYNSLFAFCTGEFAFSEDATCSRIAVSRLASRFPRVVELLRESQVSLTVLRLVGPHLNEANCEQLLSLACGKTIHQTKQLLAALNPQPPVEDSIRKLPTPSLPPPVESPGLFSLRTETAPVLLVEKPTPPPLAHRPKVEPLAPDSYRVQFTADEELRGMLKEAQALLRHSIPDGNLASVVKQGLALLIAKVKKKKYGIGAKPRAPKAPSVPVPPTPKTDEATPSSTPPTRHIPMQTRREVVERDGLRCTFVSEDGRRCEATGFLELDHLEGFARVPKHSTETLAVKCSTHNQLAAEQLYGSGFMRRAREFTLSKRIARPDSSTRRQSP